MVASQTQHGGRFWAELEIGLQPLPSMRAWQSLAFTSLRRESGPQAGCVLIGLQDAQAPWGCLKVWGFNDILLPLLVIRAVLLETLFTLILL